MFLYSVFFYNSMTETQQGFNPPLNQGAQPPVNQGFNPPLNQGAQPPVNQGFNPPLNQGFNPPLNQGFNQPPPPGYNYPPPNYPYGPPPPFEPTAPLGHIRNSGLELAMWPLAVCACCCDCILGWIPLVLACKLLYMFIIDHYNRSECIFELKFFHIVT